MLKLPDHVFRFIEINTAARVLILCKKTHVSQARSLARYTQAVQEAVLRLLQSEPPTPSIPAIDQCLNQQLEMLEIALRKPPPPRLPARVRVGNEVAAARLSRRMVQEPEDKEALNLDQPRPLRKRRRVVTETPVAKSLEEKLEEARQPLRKLLQEDCIRLGLLETSRAAECALQLVGKALTEAEAEIVDEIRNNLHEQINYYLDQHQGGPWDSAQAVEDLHKDIANVNSLHGIVSLTRQLLNECRDWEQRAEPGRTSSLISGRFGAPPKK